MTPTQAIAQLKAKMRRSSHQVRGVFNNFDTDHDQIVSRVQFSRCLDRLGAGAKQLWARCNTRLAAASTSREQQPQG